MKKPLLVVSRGVHKTALRFNQFWKSTRVYPLLVFLKELIKNPKAIGAACPSSARLARKMAEAIPLDDDGIVIELGGGTGVITQEIINHGVDPSRIYVVERSRAMCQLLRKRFENINVVEADASELTKHFPEGTRISAVVSGLPLRSLPQDVVVAISSELRKLLPQGCMVIQFTYALPSKDHFQFPMQRVNSNIVWNNIPPARVDVCKMSTPA